mgnify:CR=1 FL=1
MLAIAVKKLELFIEQYLMCFKVRSIIVIGSASGTRYTDGVSDIDTIVIADDVDFTRTHKIMDDGTEIDYTLGTYEAVLENYLHGDGRAFAWLLLDSFIYLDDAQFTAKQLIAAIQQAPFLKNKPVPTPAWRIGLTNKCNFDCFFCHKEGLNSSSAYQKTDFKRIYHLILQGILQGCRDFTFTGGEPLLYASAIAKLLRKISYHPCKPHITIVTNGIYINEELLSAAQAYEDINFNISYHSTVKELFQMIIRRSGNEYEVVTTNLNLLAKYKLRFALNYVLLRNINAQPEQIEAVLDFAQSIGAEAVKFLELLVTDALIGYYEYYCDVQYVETMLKERLVTHKEVIRRREYLLKGSELKVYIQRCRCRLGCSRCRFTADRIVTPSLTYEPCFYLAEQVYSINSLDLQSTFELGDQLIDKMAMKYKHNSPLLISDPEFTSGKTQVFYKVAASMSDCLEMLKHIGWELTDLKNFKEQYYYPASRATDYDIYKNICKDYVYETYNNSYNLFYSIIDFKEEAGVYCTTTNYLRPQGPMTLNKEELAEYVQKNDLEKWLELSWQIRVLIKGIQTISLGYCAEAGILTVCSEHGPIERELLESLSAEIIQMPLLEYIQKDLCN